MSTTDDSYVEPYVVPETGHEVRSTWEEVIDKMLHDSPYDYEYEPRRFDLGNRTYLPDFIVEDQVVLEVKGVPDRRAWRKASSFMHRFREFDYVVVGRKIPCDRHIPWGERDELLVTLLKILT